MKEEMLRTEVLRRNLVRKVPYPYICFYEALRKKDFNEALILLHELGEIHDPVLNLINPKYYDLFATPLLRRTTNENDICELFTAAVFRLVSKDLWLERISVIGYDSLIEFIMKNDFPYVLFRKNYIDTFLDEVKENIIFFADLFNKELHEIISNQETDINMCYASSLCNLFITLDNNEKETFRSVFLRKLPEIPENGFLETKIIVEKFIGKK